MVACKGSVYFRIAIPSFMFNEKMDVVNECIKSLYSQSYNSPAISETHQENKNQQGKIEKMCLYTIDGCFIGLYDVDWVMQTLHGVFLALPLSQEDDQSVTPKLLIL